ncbi:hypothetical protein ACRAWF_46865 [Streptomyces sp. L7]
MATLDLDDLETVREPYRGFKVYARSKLAQMTFAIELDQRLRASGSPVISLLAHPGGALDGLTPPRPPLFERTGDQRRRALLQVPVAQSKEHAAWPAVRATLDPRAQGGQLWGPRFLRSRGKPALETVPAKMRNTDAARRLWRATEEATGITWPSTEARAQPSPVRQQPSLLAAAALTERPRPAQALRYQRQGLWPGSPGAGDALGHPTGEDWLTFSETRQLLGAGTRGELAAARKQPSGERSQ